MRLVIFDLDGTMIDSQAIICESMRLAFAEFGLEPPAREEILSIIGLTLNVAIAKLLNRPIDDEIEAMAGCYRNRYAQMQKLPEFKSPYYDGIGEVVEELSNEAETLLAIATGKSRRGLNSMIDVHGLRDKLVAWRSADDCPSKPHPAMILQCCEIAGCDPWQSVMVGDSNYDMLMAKNAGARALGVSWGYQPVEALKNSGAHMIIDKPSELVWAIGNLLKAAAQ